MVERTPHPLALRRRVARQARPRRRDGSRGVKSSNRVQRRPVIDGGGAIDEVISRGHDSSKTVRRLLLLSIVGFRMADVTPAKGHSVHDRASSNCMRRDQPRRDHHQGRRSLDERTLDVALSLESCSGSCTYREAAPPALPIPACVLRDPPETNALASTTASTNARDDTAGSGGMAGFAVAWVLEKFFLAAPQLSIGCGRLRAKNDAGQRQSRPTQHTHRPAFR